MAEYKINTPIDPEFVKTLKIGDIIYITGQIFTARDEAHEKMLHMQENGESQPFKPDELALFHCGPVMKQTEEGWQPIAAGPTTSSRMEIFEDKFLDTFGTKIIIGKGGMGPKTQAALQKNGAVFAAYTGGAGAMAAKMITKVSDVYYLDELGMPESVWILDVEEFGPLRVAMDRHGQSLFKQVNEEAEKRLPGILAKL